MAAEGRNSTSAFGDFKGRFLIIENPAVATQNRIW